MPELIGGLAAFLVVVLYLATPFFAIVAWARSRRIAALERRLVGAERQLRIAQTLSQLAGPLAAEHRRPLHDEPAPAPEPAPSIIPEPPPSPVSLPLPRPPAPPIPGVREDGPSVEPWIPEEPPPRLFPADARPVARHWDWDWRAVSEAWEERIGGSVLSKAGALLVVIGVSLFVGWSMVHLGPVGRVAIALAISGCLLAVGLAFQRWPQYRSVAIGLSAAGWGGLYVTSYAMHGLESARVIDDAATALGLLLAVAAGMIMHALWLGVPSLVAVSYAAAFAAVAFGPASTYAVVACVVLAASLLAVAARGGQSLLAVGGIICTYGTLAFRLPPSDGPADGWYTITAPVLVWVSWLMFEAFDVLIMERRPDRPNAQRALLPLNLLGLLGVSTLRWSPGLQGYDLFLAAAAVAYGSSTLCRVFIGRRSPAQDDASPAALVAFGDYDASITIATVLWAAALWMRFDVGWRLHVGLLMEAEFLFLVGVVFRRRYLRTLSGAVFVVLLLRFVASDLPGADAIRFRGLTLAGWTPSALLAAVLLAVNRVILARTENKPLLAAEQFLATGASALVAIVIAGETWQRHNGLGPEMLGVAWLAQAWILLQLGVRLRFIDAYVQACLLGFLAIVPLVMINAFPGMTAEWIGVAPLGWVWLAPAAVMLYAMGWQMSRSSRFATVEQAEADVGQSGLLAAALLSLALIWHALPAPLVAVGWGGFAVLSFHLGLRLPDAGLRWHAFIAVALAVGRLFLANFTNTGMTGFVSHRLVTVVPIILLLYHLASRLADGEVRRLVCRNERTIGRMCSWAGTTVLVVLLRFELGRVLAVVGWTVVGLVLLALDRRHPATRLRWQSHAIALLTFARGWGTHFYVPEGAVGLLQPWVVGGIVVAGLFASELLCPPDGRVNRPLSGPGRLLGWLDAHRRSFYAILGTALLAILLAHEVPPSLLTATFGIEGACLLVLGFVRPDRALRTCGLAVLGICLPKLFFYDLRHLDTPYRILSFLLLGILLIAASWIYARYKSRLRDIV